MKSESVYMTYTDSLFMSQRLCFHFLYGGRAVCFRPAVPVFRA